MIKPTSCAVYMAVALILTGCNSNKPVYYSDVNNADTVASSKEKVVEDTYNQEDAKKKIENSNLQDVDNNDIDNSSESTPSTIHDINNNNNMANGGYIASDGSFFYYVLPNSGLDRTSSVLCKRNLNDSDQELLIEVEGDISELTFYKDYIFFCNDGLCRINKDGSNYSRLISDDDVFGIYIDNDWVYFGNKYKLKPDGTNLKKIYDSGNIHDHTMNFFDNYAYFNERYVDGEKKETRIGKRELNSSNVEILCDKSVFCLSVYGDYLFYDDDGKLCRMKTDGSDMAELYQAPCNINSINFLNDYIVFCCGQSGGFGRNKGIYISDFNGENVEYIYNDRAFTPIVIDDWIYFKQAEDGIHSSSIYRIKKDGSGFEKFAGNYSSTSHLKNYINDIR